ncbi:DUF397 domain-containing protein [Streptomyces sp. NBC_01387]|uniref:DUF397 domain-containing protein n=1 Tax=unclassified Streptomyces TaxID=2593676 RepID=UPI0022574D07|nr:MULTISPECIES: DUF397 domain-containing protein [unclassified Streptomyces]MCX4550892.1 DUF397 domain-containing protein [Streptomyces sp. NBC_01500]WSC22314.1 DUF397 domain-containing protein [Streptomyces sp. NBC_01766]WSV56161.1 DUF397 domain-containing protein [Streptomyces sp. NBC_01014]
MKGQFHPRWFKSTYSGGSGTECVACLLMRDGALVRDSKQPNAALLTVSGAAWAQFAGAVRVGRLG